MKRYDVWYDGAVEKASERLMSNNQSTFEYGIQTLKDRYLLDTEVSPQENFARAACAFADDSAHAQRLYNYASKLWFGFATPVLCNAGTERGLPISCFLSQVDDSCEGLANNYCVFVVIKLINPRPVGISKPQVMYFTAIFIINQYVVVFHL